jgi:hypothetical protein
MLVKVTGMSAIIVPAKTTWPGKEHARLVVDGIITFPGIRHKFSMSNNKVPDTRCSMQEEASRDIEKMMETLPLQGQVTNNLGIISRASSMSNTSKPIRSSSSSKT